MNFPVMTLNLCSELHLGQCPAGAERVTPSSTSRESLDNGCVAEFNDFGPGAVFVHDPLLNADYPVEYASVAVQVLCPQPADIYVYAEARPNTTTTAGSKTEVPGVCPSRVYCSATAAWGHSVIVDHTIFDYEVATADNGVNPHTYFPGYRTAGLHVW